MSKGAVYALDAENGTLMWKTQVDAHPTGPHRRPRRRRIETALYVAVGSSEPSAARDAAYACCTFRGSVAALDIATGRVVWKNLSRE